MTLILAKPSGGTTGSVTASDVSVDGAPFVVIENGDVQNSLESVDMFLLNARSSGIRFGGIATVDGGLGVGTTVSITAGAGQILDNTDAENPSFSSIAWTAKTSEALDTTTPNITYWYVDDNTDAIKQTTTKPTRSNERTRIYLFVTSYTGGAITGLAPIVSPTQQVGQSLRDFATSIGNIRESGLNPSGVASSLSLALSAGGMFSFGSNYNTDYTDPHVVAFGSFDSSGSDVFRYVTSAGIIATDETNIDVGNYQSSGVVTAIPGASGRVGLHFVFRFVDGAVRVAYGSDWYQNLASAEEALGGIDPFSLVPSIFSEEALLLGVVIAEKGETDITNATFIQTNKFGSIGGGISTAGGNYLEITNNLSDLDDAATARTNLGLGSAATTDSTDYATAAQGALADSATQPADIADFETTTQLNTRDTDNRDRANHTGTQTASTISDFDTEVSNNASVAANTAKISYTDAAKVAGIEAGADVTDATNVDAAGAVMESDVDAKGDIFVATADNTLTRLAVGTNDQVLTADSTEASGVKWADAGGGGGSSFRATKSSQSITANVNTKVQCNTEVFDTNSDYDNSTNYRFTPTVAGKYQFNMAVEYSSPGSSNAMQVYLYKNGAEYQKLVTRISASYSNAPLNLSCMADANGSTDYFELYTRHSSGTRTIFNSYFEGFLAE